MKRIRFELAYRCASPATDNLIRIARDAEGWITNGHFAALVDRLPSGQGMMAWASDRESPLAKLIRQSTAAASTAVPLREIEDLYLPPLLEVEAVEVIDAEDEDCEYDVMKDPGQAIFETPAGGRVILNPRYMPLLRGLELRHGPYRDAPDGDLGQVLGLHDGVLVVILMPMRVVADLRFPAEEAPK